MLIHPCGSTFQSFYPQQHHFQVCVTHSFCEGPQGVVLSPQVQRKLKSANNPRLAEYLEKQIFLSSTFPYEVASTGVHMCFSEVCTPVCTHIMRALKEQALKLLSHFRSFALSAIELMA